MKCCIPQIAKLHIAGFGFLDIQNFKNEKSKNEFNWGEHKKTTLLGFFKTRTMKGLSVEEKFDLNTILDIFLNESFRKPATREDKSVYKVTACIGRKYLYDSKPKPLDGIAYPSISRDYKAFNWAFHTKTVDTYFVFVEFLKIRVTKKTKEGAYLYEEIDHSLDCRDGNIVWENL